MSRLVNLITQALIRRRQFGGGWGAVVASGGSGEYVAADYVAADYVEGTT